MYKPHFCAECGEQVIRSQWRLWTSRSFCEGCSRRLRRGRVVAPVVAGAALLGGGFFVGHAFRADPPPLMVLRGNLPAAPVALAATNPPPNPEPASYGPDGSATERPTEATETTYLCGARTKKGTPCSRRVRFPGRCYQHKGLPAMLPQEQLIVKG